MVDLEQTEQLAAPRSRHQQQASTASACAYQAIDRFTSSSAPVNAQYLQFVDSYRQAAGHVGYACPEGVAASSCSSQSSAGCLPMAPMQQPSRSPGLSTTPCSTPSAQVLTYPCSLCSNHAGRGVAGQQHVHKLCCHRHVASHMCCWDAAPCVSSCAAAAASLHPAVHTPCDARATATYVSSWHTVVIWLAGTSSVNALVVYISRAALPCSIRHHPPHGVHWNHHTRR
jgi:hypothetical protein